MSNYCDQWSSSKPQLKLNTERIKVLKVIGEEIGQVLLENSLPINAIKIDRINAELKESTDHIFCNKIVKQGIIHKQIFYVDPDNNVRHTSEDVPFIVAVDIPGVDPKNPYLEIQNHLLDIDVEHILTPAKHDGVANLNQKVVAHILIKVSEWVELEVVTKADIFPKIGTSDKNFGYYSTCGSRRY